MAIETVDRESCRNLDAADSLAAVRESFLLPEGVIFMGGNSLGPLSVDAAAAVDRLVRSEWGVGLLRSWNEAGWIEAPMRIGAKLATFLGAQPDEVIVTDSTSVNLFKLLVGALRATPERRVILTEATNFPTDLYISQGISDLLGVEVLAVPREEILDRLDDSIAVLALTHVNYLSGARYDMAAVTGAAHDAGALMLWDLSHSAGSVPLDLNGSGVDLAVGCGYKYLNGGPGAPGYLYVSRDLQDTVHQPIWGWMGHAHPFTFDSTYSPEPGMGKYLSGTPVMVAMAALEAAVDLWLAVDSDAVWQKGRQLGELAVKLIEERLAPLGVTLVTPRDPDQRGSHLSLRHPNGYAVVRAAIDRGIIGDFRPPDIMRYALAPLYMRYADVWDAVEGLRDILATRAFEQEEYAERRKVT